jgi:hypothetical protein
VSELTDILDEAEVERLWAERDSLQVQLDAVAKRIAEIDRAIVASGEAKVRVNRRAYPLRAFPLTGDAETTHQCPPDGGGGLMPCCGLTPFEVPRTDRMTLDPALVTCHKEGGQS